VILSREACTVQPSKPDYHKTGIVYRTYFSVRIKSIFDYNMFSSNRNSLQTDILCDSKWFRFRGVTLYI